MPSVEHCERREAEKCVLSQPEFTFFARFPIDEWFRCTFWEKAKGNIGGHETLDAATYAAFRGNLYGMFRHPTKRVVSAFLWYQSEFFKDPPAPDILTYAQRARGTQAKMLAGQADGESCNSGYGYWSRCDTALSPDVALAIARMREGFAYVGLTDEWPLSICLFHARLGGQCLRSEFYNSRPTTPRVTRLPWIRNTSLLNYTQWATEQVAAVGDPYDAELYAAVEARVRAEVAQLKLTRERCEALCPDAPMEAFATARFG